MFGWEMFGFEFEISWILIMGIGELLGMFDEMLVLRGVGGGGVNLWLIGILFGVWSYFFGYFMFWKLGWVFVEWIIMFEYR